jgi:N-acetylglucosamine-6-sulfatase
MPPACNGALRVAARRYHLGQFCFGADKRQPYETDIRVPFAVTGPGVRQGVVEEAIALNIDLLPTFVELAGGTPPENVDGASLAPIILENYNGAAAAEAEVGSSSSSSGNVSQRQFFLVDYYGEGAGECHLYGGKCPPQERGGTTALAGSIDSSNNTYHCVRQLVTPQTTESLTRMYCEFEDDEGFKELYEMKDDPWQMTNVAYSNKTNTEDVLKFMQTKLDQLRNCTGAMCRQFQY